MFIKYIPAIGAGVLLLSAAAASAEMYKDYTPDPGIWSETVVEVDPNHVDDYLVGLKASQIPAMEIMKKHGLIDNYIFMVKDGYNAGAPNVIIATHYVNAAAMEPDQGRDQAIEKEIYATFSKEKGDAAVAGYEKYRKFTEINNWRTITFTK